MTYSTDADGTLVATNISNAYENSYDLVTFLESSDGIKYQIPETVPSITRLKIQDQSSYFPKRAYEGRQRNYIQAIKTDEGRYSMIAFYIDYSKNPEGDRGVYARYPSFSTPEEAIADFQRQIDKGAFGFYFTLTPPKTRHTTAELNIQ